MRYITFVLLIIVLNFKFAISQSFDSHFNLILPLGYTQLHTQFPGNKLTQVSSIDMSMISKNDIPRFWPQRIPFVAGISGENKNLFYYQFEPLGYSKLIDIPVNDGPIKDVAVTSDGSIFSITNNFLYIHTFDFKQKKIIKLSEEKMQSTLKCVSNHSNKVAILSKHSLMLYRYKNKSLNKLKSTSKKINSILKNYNCKNIAINSKGEFIVVTKKSLLFFSSFGVLLNEIPNTFTFDLVDFTSYGDYIVGSSKNTTLAKYTSTGVLLFESKYLIPEEALKDIAIYQPYGNIALFGNENGAYYSMKTSLNVENTTSIIQDNLLSITTRFKLTFPSLVSISILDSDNNPILLEQQKKLPAGIHQLTWRKLSPHLQDKELHFVVKGLYSNANKITVKKSLEKAL